MVCERGEVEGIEHGTRSFQKDINNKMSTYPEPWKNRPNKAKPSTKWLIHGKTQIPIANAAVFGIIRRSQLTITSHDVTAQTLPPSLGMLSTRRATSEVGILVPYRAVTNSTSTSLGHRLLRVATVPVEVTLLLKLGNIAEGGEVAMGIAVWQLGDSQSVSVAIEMNGWVEVIFDRGCICLRFRAKRTRQVITQITVATAPKVPPTTAPTCTFLLCCG